MGYWVLIGGMGYESFDCIASGHQNITTYESCTRAPHGRGAFMPAAVGLHRRVQIFQNLWPTICGHRVQRDQMCKFHFPGLLSVQVTFKKFQYTIQVQDMKLFWKIISNAFKT